MRAKDSDDEASWSPFSNIPFSYRLVNHLICTHTHWNRRASERGFKNRNHTSISKKRETKFRFPAVRTRPISSSIDWSGPASLVIKFSNQILSSTLIILTKILLNLFPSRLCSTQVNHFLLVHILKKIFFFFLVRTDYALYKRLYVLTLADRDNKTSFLVVWFKLWIYVQNVCVFSVHTWTSFLTLT